MELKLEVQTLLGSPKVDVELMDSHFEYAEWRAEDWAAVCVHHPVRRMRRKYAIATCFMILGRIRSDEGFASNGETLLRDSRRLFSELGCGPYG